MSTKLKNPNEDFAEYGSLEYVDPKKMDIVYGPVLSRRLGHSVGVNLLGTAAKVCSFACPYCDLGPTTIRLNRIKSDTEFPTLEKLEQALREGFTKAHQSPEKVHAISISGNGEPTLYPLFPEAVDLIVRSRDLYLPNTPISIFTNGVNLDTRKTTDALNRVEERMLKIDAGNERVFKAINSPLVRASITKIISSTKHLRDCIVQSFFVQGAVDNTLSSDLEDWIEVIGLIRPKAVHIHGMSRVPSVRGLQPCSEDTLYTIVQKLERRTQIRALVFP